MIRRWKPGDIFVWRGIYRNHIWHAVPTYVVQETPQEIVGAILPQAICMVEEHYTPGVKAGKRRWDFKDEDWVLDEDDYHQAIEEGAILPEWVQGIEKAIPEVLERLEKRKYPFDGSWLNWMPDPAWLPPTLPENWDKI